MKKIKKVSLQSEIIESIKKYIEDQNLKSGDQLPSQMQMVNLLGISRTSLREALKTLEAHDIIEIVNGKGVFVKNSSSNLIVGGIELERERETLLEVVEVRRVLEKEIIHMVIQKATEEELDKIQHILDRAIESYYRHESRPEYDKEFHIELYKTCHNRVMVQLIVYVEKAFEKLWQYPLGLHEPFKDTMPFHKEMFEWIRKRDVKKAQAANDKILNAVTKELLGKE